MLNRYWSVSNLWFLMQNKLWLYQKVKPRLFYILFLRFLSFDVLLLSLNSWRDLSSPFPDPQDVVSIQIKNILAPGVADPEGHWHSCKLDINNCSPDQLDLMQGEYFLERLCQQVFILFSPHNIISCLIWTLVKAFKGQRNSWFQVITAVQWPHFHAWVDFQASGQNS